MKTAMLAKVALCVCPPAIAVTSVAAVPPVRKAVHRLTKPHHVQSAKPSARPALLVRTAAAPGPCAPGDGQAVSILNYASEPPPIPGEFGTTGLPGGLFNGGGGGFGPGGGFVAGPGGGGTGGNPGTPIGPGPTPTPTPTPTPPGGGGEMVPPVTPAIPEPATWAMMILGFGVVGAAVRGNLRFPKRKSHSRSDWVSGSRRRKRGLAGLLASLAPTSLLEAGTSAGAVGANSLASGAVAKTLLCVCPTAALALTAAAVPPVRHAVYKATMPAISRPVAATAAPVEPACDPRLTAQRVLVDAAQPASGFVAGQDVQPRAILPSEIVAQSSVPGAPSETVAANSQS